MLYLFTPNIPRFNSSWAMFGKDYKVLNIIVDEMAKVNKFIFQTPRILAVLFIIFLALFSLDIFEGNYGFWGTILGLFMHNIPSMVLLIILIISWKHELVGAITFILVGILYIVFNIITGNPNAELWYTTLFIFLQISGTTFLIGILFLINWFKKR